MKLDEYLIEFITLLISVFVLIGFNFLIFFFKEFENLFLILLVIIVPAIYQVGNIFIKKYLNNVIKEGESIIYSELEKQSEEITLISQERDKAIEEYNKLYDYIESLEK